MATDNSKGSYEQQLDRLARVELNEMTTGAPFAIMETGEQLRKAAEQNGLRAPSRREAFESVCRVLDVLFNYSVPDRDKAFREQCAHALFEFEQQAAGKSIDDVIATLRDQYGIGAASNEQGAYVVSESDLTDIGIRGHLAIREFLAYFLGEYLALSNRQ